MNQLISKFALIIFIIIAAAIATAVAPDQTILLGRNLKFLWIPAVEDGLISIVLLQAIGGIQEFLVQQLSHAPGHAKWNEHRRQLFTNFLKDATVLLVIVIIFITSKTDVLNLLGLGSSLATIINIGGFLLIIYFLWKSYIALRAALDAP